MAEEKKGESFFDNYQKHSLTRPRDEAWGNWKSWKDAKVGDKLQGYVVDAFYRPADAVFREQRGITLRQTDGQLINVGVKYLPFILASTDNLHIGDPLVIELTKIQAPQAKGQQGAKVFSYFGTNLPENANNKTVRQLTEEDRLAGGSSQSAKDVEVSDDDTDTSNASGESE